MDRKTQYTISCEDALAFICEAEWGFAEIDSDGNFSWMNDSYAEILNSPRDLIVGTNFRTWTHPDDLNIDSTLAEQVKAGLIPGYTLSKRYIQRGSTPQMPRIIWGLLSVTGKWMDGKFVGYRAQFQPYQAVPTKDLTATIQGWIELIKKNWKTAAMVLALLSSLMGLGSDRLLNMLRQVKEVKSYVDTVSGSSEPGASSQQP